MNKYIILLLILASSCSLLDVERKSIDTYSQRMYKCVTELIGKYNVPAEKATAACKIIFGGQQ